jgi:hypothetical protein
LFVKENRLLLVPLSPTENRKATCVQESTSFSKEYFSTPNKGINELIENNNEIESTPAPKFHAKLPPISTPYSSVRSADELRAEIREN